MEGSDTLYATVNGLNLKMVIDTGASALIISEETYGKLWTNDQTQALCQSSVKLSTYVGEIILEVSEHCLSQLGWDWLSKIIFSFLFDLFVDLTL